MHEDDRHALLLMARLFQYPDDAWRDDLPQLRQHASQVVSAPRHEPIIAFIDGAVSMSPLSCQEQYTATFELAPANTLDLTYHSCGESEDRSRALLAIEDIYAAAGLERTTGELPDFLPTVLEFLSVAAAGHREAMLVVIGPGLLTLDDRLKAGESPFAALTSQLIERFDITAAPIAGSPGEDIPGGWQNLPANPPMEKTT